MDAQIYIHNGTQMLSPAVEKGVEWTTERKGVPGKLTFSALQDTIPGVSEGNPVSLNADGKTIFVGYIFRISRTQGGTAKITAYDQLRYLKNKDSYSFEAAKANEIISMIAADYGVRVGEIADTGYTIPARVEDNSTLLDMMQTALEITLTNTRNMYVLYDDGGALTLKNAADMRVGLLIDADTAESYAYDVDIDEESYNRVKLSYEDEKKGKRQVFIAEDDANQQKWGTLQLFETVDDTENAQNKANMMLALYNTPKRSLKISGVLGDWQVRAGCFVAVRLELSDTQINNFMLVETCCHKIENDKHSMDITVRGGDFTG